MGNIQKIKIVEQPQISVDNLYKLLNKRFNQSISFYEFAKIENLSFAGVLKEIIEESKVALLGDVDTFSIRLKDCDNYDKLTKTNDIELVMLHDLNIYVTDESYSKLYN